VVSGGVEWMCAERGTAARPVDANAPMPRLLLLLLLLLLRSRLLRCYWRMSCSLVSAWPYLCVVQAKESLAVSPQSPVARPNRYHACARTERPGNPCPRSPHGAREEKE